MKCANARYKGVQSVAMRFRVVPDAGVEWRHGGLADRWLGALDFGYW